MSREERLPKLIAVVGPTASGKTELAVALAKKFDGEIVSADSRQLYRGTEIGSDIIPGKWVAFRPGSGQRARRTYVAKGVPHHLIAILPPSRTLTAAEYKKKALAAIGDITRRGKVPILAGGTGLYIRAVVDNLDIPEVPPDPVFRKKMERLPTSRLFAMLLRRDPVYARRIPKQNRRYIIRALEVAEKTGRPFSEAQGRGAPLFEVLQIGVRQSRAELYRRIEKRVEVQMRRGLLEEARRLGCRHGWDLPAMTGLGHRQLGAAIRGEITLEEAVRLIKRDTRRFAKRQLGWYRRDQRIRWVKGAEEAGRLVSKFLR